MVAPARQKPASRDVLLLGTCLCDVFFDDVARATVEVLEYAGCSVTFPPDQTCCGQPAFNGGDWKASRKVVRHCAEVFAGDQPIIVPSGSCAAMLFHGAPLAFAEEEDRATIDRMAARTWEVCDYLVNGLGLTDWPGRFPHTVAFHRSCHSRGTESGPAAETLLRAMDGLQLATFGEQEQCCGFGGTFAVSFPNISAAMGNLKLEHIQQADPKPEYLASADMGCLLHLGGMLDKAGVDLPRRHIIQIVRDGLRATGKLPAVA